MPTRINTKQVLDGTIGRDDLNSTDIGQAVVKKIVQGSNIVLSSTGADAGTGDVTVSADLSGVSLQGHTHSFSEINPDSLPSTLSGYNITDSYTKSEVDSKVAGNVYIQQQEPTGAVPFIWFQTDSSGRIIDIRRGY